MVRSNLQTHLRGEGINLILGSHILNLRAKLGPFSNQVVLESADGHLSPRALDQSGHHKAHPLHGRIE